MRHEAAEAEGELAAHGPGGQSLRADWFFRVAVGFAALALFLAPVLQALKLLDLTAAPGRALFYFRLSATTLAFSASYLLLLSRNRLKVSGLDVLLVFLLVWGGVFTVFFGGTVVDIAGNLLRLAFILACYQTARRYAHTVDLSRALKWFGVLGLAGVVVGLIVVYWWGVLGGRPVYLGLSTQGLFVALAFVLAREGDGDWLWVGLFMLLIVAGGKRGNMLAAMGMILVAVLFVRRMSRRKVAAVSFVTVCAAFLFVGIDYAVLAGALPEPLAQRFLVWIPGSGTGIDLAEATSNRVTEVLAVVEMWKETPMATISGFGLGAIIPKGAAATASTVHISPVALAFQYGIPLAAMVLLAIYAVPVRTLLQERSSLGVEERTWCLTAVGLLALSTTVFTVLQDPVLWVALGRLSAREPGHQHQPRL